MPAAIVKPVIVVKPDHTHPTLDQPTVHVNPKNYQAVEVVRPVINLYNDEGREVVLTNVCDGQECPP
jgi:hypothetical protein